MEIVPSLFTKQNNYKIVDCILLKLLSLKVEY